MSGFAEPINLSQWTVIWAWFCRADCFLTAGREQTAKSARLTQPEWIGIQIKWVWIWDARAEEDICLSSNQVHIAESRHRLCTCPIPPPQPSGSAVTWWDHLRQKTSQPAQTLPSLPEAFSKALQSVTTDFGWIFCSNLGLGDWSPCPQAIQSPSNHVLLITVPYVMMSGMWIIALCNANLIFRVISLQRKPWCSVKVWIREQEMRY